MIEEIKDKWKELEARKRAELEASLEAGQIADPFSSSILISLAISSALSAASYIVSRALAPKPPRQQQGKLTGSLQLQNSEQGIFIPEIYGGSPSTSLVTGSNLTYQNNANGTAEGDSGYTKTSGGSTTWNCGASHNVQINSGDQAWVKFKVLSGYAAMGFTTTASPVSGNTDFKFGIQWNPDGAVSIKYNNTAVLANVATWVAGDEFTVWLDSRFRLFKGAAEITPDNFIFPAPTFPLWVGIAVQVMGAGISEAKVQINNLGNTPNSGRGGIKVPAIIVWSSGIRKLVTTTQVSTGGGKGGGGRTQTVDNVTYNIDLGLMFTAQGPHNLIREYANADILIDQFVQSANPSGVHDPTVGPDPDYDPMLPPDPGVNHLLATSRVDGDIPTDLEGVGTGTIQGGGSSFAIYPGNDDQQPDPTIEADIDGKFGAGSTPAYRNRSLIVHTNLSLSRWGGVVPNITAVWEHETLKTLDVIFASLCERVGVLAANSDYDFTGIPIASRGLLISGRTFAPKEVIGSPDLQLAYNYFVTEADGQVIAFEEGDEPSVTIPDTEVGWLEGDAELPDIAPEIETIIAPEISLPREVHVKSLDPDNDWEPNTQSAMRQITDGSTVELLEIQICQLSDERRETAQRKLYRDYVAGTAHKFTLSWKYLYLYPGYKVIITRAEGFTHTFRLTSISGGIGLLECEGVALEPETFIQPANGVFPTGHRPSQPIPAMIVMSMLDIPLFRDSDEGRIGYYACGTPRTGVNQTFQGWTLHSQRNGIWSLRAASDLPGTIGTVVSATTLSSDPETFDPTGTITVDLYGTSMTLSSVTEADVLAGVNIAVAKDFIFGFTTATQVAGFPNRWTLSGLLNGLHGTAHLVAGDLTGSRFVLLDNAIEFVPTTMDEINLLLPYRGVASGQSLGDAATFNFAWTGKNITPKKQNAIIVYRDTKTGALANQIQIVIPTRDRLVGEAVKYWVDVYSATAGPTFTVDTSTDVFTSTGHGLVAGDMIALSTTSILPSPLQRNKHYYLRDITTNTFKLSASDGGAAINLLNAGSGTHKFTKRVRSIPVVNFGAFNPAVITIYTPDDTPPPDGEWQHATTAGSGGWDSTITTEWTLRNDVVGSGPGAAGSGISAAVLTLITEPGAEVEFTLGTVDYEPGSETAVYLNDPAFDEDGNFLPYREMRFTLFTDGSLPTSKAGSRRWKLTIHERIGGTLTLVYTDPDLELPGMRYRMQISGTELRYYRDYGGPNSTLLYRSTVPLIYPMRLRAGVNVSHVIENIKIGGLPECVTTYPDTDMITDFGTQPSTVRLRVYEEKTLSGVTLFGDATDFIT